MDEDFKSFSVKQPLEAPEGIKRKIVFEGKKIPATIFTMQGQKGPEKIALIYKPHSFYASVRVVRL